MDSNRTADSHSPAGDPVETDEGDRVDTDENDRADADEGDLVDADEGDQPPGRIANRPTTLGHVHLKVRDLDRAVDFYTAVLGLDVEERHGRFAFLTFGRHHHDVALQELGPHAPEPGRGVGLYHAAFEVETADALTDIFERLRERGISVTPVDHRISKALYFDDPDGNGLEVYLDTREENDRETWGGENRPFDPLAL